MEQVDIIIAHVLNLKPGELTNELGMDNFGAWDSLRHMDIIVEMEKAFSFEFTFDEIADMTSVGKIRETVSKKLN